jgi:hypothetical protein
MSLILATWKADIGRSWFKANPGKGTRPNLKNKLKAKKKQTNKKDWECGSSGRELS